MANPKIEYMTSHHPMHGTIQKAYIPIENENDSLAQCTECGLVSKTHPSLPHFELNSLSPYDSYYCGCRGWD